MCSLSFSDVFDVKEHDSGGADIELQTSTMTALFSSTTGLLRSLKLASSEKPLMVEADLVTYGIAGGKDRSGAYLFRPDREASSFVGSKKPVVRVVVGQLVKSVQAVYDVVVTSVELHSPPSVSSYSLSIVNTVDIRSLQNKVSQNCV